MPETDTLLRLRTPADLIATLPYLFGYRLHDSLVVAAVRDGQLGVMQRLDLPGTRHGRPVRGALQLLRRTLHRDDPDVVMIVAFESVPGASGPLRTAVSRLCDRHGWRVLIHLVVRDGRWWYLDAGDDLCEQGRLLPEDPEVPAVAECVAAGRAPLSGREAVPALLEPTGAADLVTQHLMAVGRRRQRSPGSAIERCRQDADAWRRWLAGDFVASADDSPEAASHRECLATCVLALEDGNLRDALIAWFAPGVLPPAMVPQPAWEVLVDRLGPVPGVTARQRVPSPPDPDDRSAGDVATGSDPGTDPRAPGTDPSPLGTDPSPPGTDPAPPAVDPSAATPMTAQELRARSRNRLIDAVRGTPQAHQAPMLTVLGAIAWWHGEGTLAGEAVDRARRLRPSYTLALLLHDMIRQGVRF